MDDRRIPLIVGVTGHIALREADIPALRVAVRSELTGLMKRYPNTSPAMLTSLAAGGDLLCADVARELGIPVLAALPVEPSVYRKDFSPADAARFDEHCARARWVGVAPPTERAPEHPDRAFYFRQAGIYVATHCHVLLALWDGGAPDAKRCGTGAAVDVALNGAYSPERGDPALAGDCLAVIHILAPRDAADRRAAGEVRRLGDEAALSGILEKTEAFNRLADQSGGGGTLLPDEACGDDAVLVRMNALYHAASGLSRRFARTYRRVLALLAAASTLLTFAFLMYDEVEAIWMILLCGAMLGLAWFCHRYALRSDCHCRYIEYRALAEWLRVQAYLRYAGSRLRVTSLMTWTQSQETAWIASALRAVSIGPAPKAAHDIRDCWVNAQRDYHSRAIGRTSLSLRRSEGVVRVALTVSATLYIAAVLFELGFGGLFFEPVAALAGVGLWRTAIKVALGTLSSATIFIANYYGKQSLPRKRSDHGKMARFYARASEQLAERGQSEELLARLAREELIENGNWLSYQRDNTPDINL